MSAPDLNTQHTLSLQIRHQSVHTVRTEWVCCRLAVLGSHVTPRSASTIHRRLPAYLAFRIRYLLAGLAGNYVRYGYYPYPAPHCSVLLSPAAEPAYACLPVQRFPSVCVGQSARWDLSLLPCFLLLYVMIAWLLIACGKKLFPTNAYTLFLLDY